MAVTTATEIGSLFQKADWKTEKHVPVIECPEEVKTNEIFSVKVTLGKEVAHPNTTDHHIRWIDLYYQGTDDKFPYQVGTFQFTAHGESVDGPDKGPVYTNHEVTASMKVSKPGMIFASAYCNIHGLWQSEKEIRLS